MLLPQSATHHFSDYTMDKEKIKEFFNERAALWDGEMIRDDGIISRILEGAGITSGKTVLDVACGTGVLIPDYMSRGVSSVTGIDISPEMIRIAKEKFPRDNISFICCDAEDFSPAGKFDCIMIYNAFPHFSEPERLIERLSELLSPGGTLTVAHGMSRARIDSHHRGAAREVSVGLMHEDELAAIFARHLTVTLKISDENMYQVTGVKG